MQAEIYSRLLDVGRSSTPRLRQILQERFHLEKESPGRRLVVLDDTVHEQNRHCRLVHIFAWLQGPQLTVASYEESWAEDDPIEGSLEAQQYECKT